MKDYRTYIKYLLKTKEYTVDTRVKRNTVKITHVETGEFYYAHPANHAVKPIQRWAKRIDRLNKKEIVRNIEYEDYN